MAINLKLDANVQLLCHHRI